MYTQTAIERAGQEKQGKVYLTEATAPLAADIINHHYQHLVATVEPYPTWGRGWCVNVKRRDGSGTGYRVWHIGALHYYYRLFIDAKLISRAQG